MFSTQCLLIVVHFGSTRVAESKISERQEFLEPRLKVNPPLGQIQAAARCSDDLQHLQHLFGRFQIIRDVLPLFGSKADLPSHEPPVGCMTGKPCVLGVLLPRCCPLPPLPRCLIKFPTHF